MPRGGGCHPRRGSALMPPVGGDVRRLSLPGAVALDERAEFLRGRNLWVVDLASGDEVQLTRDGGGTIGMVALGSEENQRFYADMGTLYLERIGEMVSAALARVTKSTL